MKKTITQTLKYTFSFAALFCLQATSYSQAPIHINWNSVASVSKSHPSMLVVVNEKMRRGSDIYDATYQAIRDAKVQHARFLAWYPYPRLSVAALKAPDKDSTYWDFSLLDPLVFDFLKASEGRVTHLDFSTIPQWMFKWPEPVPYPDDPNEIAFDYAGIVSRRQFRDSTLTEVTDYFVRIFQWYTQGGFTDERGKFHQSGHFLSIPYWEVLNEPEIENCITPQLYTRLYDKVVTAIHKISPDTKFVGMSSVNFKDPAFFEYFLDPAKHEPGVPIDMISYHFYAGGSDKQPYSHYQYSYYDRADQFITAVRYIESLRKRLNPTVKVSLNELGTFVSPERRKQPIPADYWNLSSAVYAYLFIELNKLGIDVITCSQIVGYPGQHPDVSMMNWENGKPNARYWTLKLINDNFGPGDKLVETNTLVFAELDYAAQAFITSTGKKLLILNKRNHDIQVKLPAEFTGARTKTVDAVSGEQEALSSKIGNDLILHMKANAVTVVFEKNATQRADLTETALIPFWKTDTMHNESVLIRSANGGIVQPRLLFTPKKIISVRNSALDTLFKEGVDWEYDRGRLKLLKGFSGTMLTDDQLNPDSAATGTFPKQHGGHILFREGSFFHKHQLAITYTHAGKHWKGPIPSYQSIAFKQLVEDLKQGKPVKLLLFGDSIAAGANASGENDAPPYLPSWGDLVAEKLRSLFTGSIEFVNTAVGGMDSRWGVQTVKDRVIKYQPDVVIIAFGMNDGTGRMPAEEFKANIQTIINQVKKHKPQTTFILVSPMLPNPESKFVGTQMSFKKALEELTGDQIVLADMTSVHAELLKHKSYQDMTGNNINHPNDFLIRWYAQQIISLLVPPSAL